MKKKLLLLLSAIMLTLKASAFEFEVDGIYYTTISTHNEWTCAITAGYNKYAGDVVIPETVTYGTKTFSVIEVAPYAFYECTNLASVVIGNEVIKIGNEAFRNCWDLTSVVIGNYVTDIGELAFASCHKLASLKMGNSVMTIGKSAFYSCNALTAVVFPNTVNTIGQYAFENCETMTSLVIPNSVKAIGQGAFEHCDGLTSVGIGNSVTDIYDYAFFGCDNLKTLMIGKSVKQIGSSAFEGNVLEEITMLGTTPPAMYNNTFHDNTKMTCTVKVPIEAVDAYLTADIWSQFWNITGFYPEKCATPIISLENGKLTVTCETEGAVCHTTIMNEEELPFEMASGKTIELTGKISVHSYASAMGKNDSETATNTFCLKDIFKETETIEIHDTTIVNVEIHDTTLVNVPPTFVKLTTEINGLASAVANVAKDSITAIDLSMTSEEWTVESVTMDGNELEVDAGTYLTPALNTNATVTISLKYNGKIVTDEELSSGIADAEWSSVKVTAHNDKITVTGLTAGDNVMLYTTTGIRLATGVAHYDGIEFTGLTAATYILSISHGGKRLGVRVMKQQD